MNNSHRTQLAPAGMLGILGLAGMLYAGTSQAQWQPDGVPVCRFAEDQFFPESVADGAGGVILVWSDRRSGLRVYAQRLNAAGVPQWLVDESGQSFGVEVCVANSDQDGAVAVSDGAGGAIIAWRDRRGTNTVNIYAQRLSPDGYVQWNPGGVPMCSVPSGIPGNKGGPVIISDSRTPTPATPFSGAIIAWSDDRGGATGYDIRAQAVNGDGQVRWEPDGVPVCVAMGNQQSTAISTDGVTLAPLGPRGAIIAWQDDRTASTDIYAQRLNPSGVAQWTADGVAACADPAIQARPDIVFSAAATAIIAWEDARSDSSDLYCQRIVAGVPQWAPNGVPLCQQPNQQSDAHLIGDGAGGVIAVWEDRRAAGMNNDLYAQRVDVNGAAVWTPASGVLVTPTLFRRTGFLDKHLGTAVGTDLAGGAIVTWEDARADQVDLHLYAQRLDATGATRWSSGGTRVCTSPSAQRYPTIMNDAAGGAIVAWSDFRNDPPSPDIYANHVDANGELVAVDARPSTQFRVEAAVPNPSVGSTGIRLELPRSERVEAEVYGVDGRMVRSLVRDRELPMGSSVLKWDGRDSAHQPVPPGIYLIRVRTRNASRTSRVFILR